MLSTLELRHLIEQSFLPTRCECTVDPTAALTVRFYQGASSQEMLVVTGISMAPLNNGYAIASLIADLRKDLERGASTSLYLAHYTAR
ncbi:DUF1652 domain-containing protein [Pseudomonas sp. Irchel s3a18]|uniref:DUF1652 domain-containing protein n=1 Tax=Pseudomonas sp. Irchel s3a18 TaxID=2009053 RepID=UPI000BA383C2|nr:DUF1652 domain-containing protein [Pseudomonas sp. Irchel s3a18]